MGEVLLDKKEIHSVSVITYQTWPAHGQDTLLITINGFAIERTSISHSVPAPSDGCRSFPIGCVRGSTLLLHKENSFLWRASLPFSRRTGPPLISLPIYF